MKKVFISHASEDKEDFVEPLAKALKGKYEVWYDDYVLVAGCSLLEEISKGLKECDYGIVILSNNFFSKEWPQKELNALVSLETKTRKVIIPIWKGVTKYQVTQYSPILADKYALNADECVMKIVQEIHRSIEYFEKGKASSAINSGFSKLKNSLEKKKEDVMKYSTQL